ncbi:thiolase family protein [Streptomyces albipurpureus]|uniref:Thiolase family protein n=1 Tax=Streptomyces albipurpureus TaxID=2897419 RepID=A0ABT0UJX8_9ACTN|nr:thiolase family protein [Streptomyces sp. CWNU-1]MCM2387581.1 thiolase family protein [Streptomyces sp. CWNU-1]
MGLRGEAAIIGIAEWKPERRSSRPRRFTIEQWAELARDALEDAGIGAREVDGIVTTAVQETSRFAPATVSEYLGIPVNYGEFVDLGGASAAGMVWRAAAAVELGIADVVLCALPGDPVPEPPVVNDAPADPFGVSSSALYGSPQAEFEIPYGNVAQNVPYAMFAQRYAAEFGDPTRAMAKIAVDQRTNACAHPAAVFHGKPITIEDVLSSPVIAEPLRLLDIVMPCSGGAAVVVANADVARRARHRPVWVKGFGERVAFKTPTYAENLMETAIAPASAQAFAMAGVTHADIDMVSVYDCYTITVLMSLEDAGFCPKGTGADFVNSRDLTFRGDFPCNTHGGQLSFGQPGRAGGMSHVCDATRQIQRRSGDNQVSDCDRAFVTGNGGIMSEQVALILQGD